MKKIQKTIKKIQNRPESEKIRIMWILVIFCMIIVIGIWKINFDLNKSNKINPINNSNNLDLPPFPKIEELNKGIDSIEKLDKEESKNLEKETLEEEDKSENLSF